MDEVGVCDDDEDESLNCVVVMKKKVEKEEKLEVFMHAANFALSLRDCKQHNRTNLFSNVQEEFPSVLVRDLERGAH